MMAYVLRKSVCSLSCADLSSNYRRSIRLCHSEHDRHSSLCHLFSQWRREHLARTCSTNVSTMVVRKSYCSPLKRKAAMIEYIDSTTDENYHEDESEYHADDEGESSAEGCTQEASTGAVVPVVACIHDPYLRKRTKRRRQSNSLQPKRVIIARSSSSEAAPVTCTSEMPAEGPPIQYQLYSLGRLLQNYLTDRRNDERSPETYNDVELKPLGDNEKRTTNTSLWSEGDTTRNATTTTGKQLCIEQAMQLTKTPHVVVEAGFPFRIVHANAAFYAVLKQRSAATLDCMTQYHSLRDTITRTFGNLPTTVHPVLASEGRFVSHYMVELAEPQHQYSTTPGYDLPTPNLGEAIKKEKYAAMLHQEYNSVEPKRAIG